MNLETSGVDLLLTVSGVANDASTDRWEPLVRVGLVSRCRSV